jgi:hypothetical protein
MDMMVTPDKGEIALTFPSLKIAVHFLDHDADRPRRPIEYSIVKKHRSRRVEGRWLSCTAVRLLLILMVQR